MRSCWKRDALLLEPPQSGFRRFELKISYNGDGFCGWQRQACSMPSVQGEIEKAIYKISSRTCTVYGSGRTDSGVHALAQVAHFDIEGFDMSADKLRLALNANLPYSIRINKCTERFDAFHARFSTFLREYIYILKSDEDFTPFDFNRAWNTRRKCDVDFLNSMAVMLKGEDMDYKNFDFTDPEIEHSSFRDTIESVFFIDKDKLCYKVIANAFLYHQVRAMVGTMVEFEKKYGKDCAEHFKKFLEKDCKTRFVAPAHGLYLSRIIYDEKEYEYLRSRM